MKTHLRIICLLLAAAFTTWGCVNEDNNFGNNHQSSSDTGTLSLSQMQLNVLPNPEVYTRQDETSTIATDNFIVEIFNSGNELVKTALYKDIISQEIQLAVGSYKITVRSADIPAVEWEKPVYSGEQAFAITKNNRTAISNIVCTLANVKTTVAYATDLAALLGEGTVTKLSMGAASTSFLKDETRAAYFKATGTTLSMELNGTFEGKPVIMNKTISNIKPGQWRKITVSYEYASQGNVDFIITVETFTYDEEVVVDVMTMNKVSEEVIADEDDLARPRVEWGDHNLADMFTFSADMFDQSGNCTEPMTITTTAQNGIASYNVKIAASNNSFIDSFGGALPSEFDLCTTSSSLVRLLGFKTGADVLNKSSVEFNLAPLAKELYAHDASYTITLSITDTKGLSNEVVLNWKVDKASEGSGPKVVWVGHNLEQRYEVAADLEVQINVTAEAGVKEFRVVIDSDVLTPTVLEGVELTSNLDLVNPGQYREKLIGLGFPVAEDVLNKTAVSFDISKFMPLIQLLDSTGYYNFVMTVEDNDGAQITKTIKLHSTKKAAAVRRVIPVKR